MHWFSDTFTIMEDLCSEAPWIGQWGFVFNTPMCWLGGLLFIN